MPKIQYRLVVFGAAALFSTSTLRADDKAGKQDSPRIFQDVIDCRNIEAPEARLACYDQKVEALRLAREDKQILVADKEQVKQSRRSLFGLTLPNLGIFGDDDDEKADAVDSIDVVIKSIRESVRGYTFTMEDGAVWAQTENAFIGLVPKPGQKMVIKKAAMGSFMAKVEGGRAFRIKRLND